LNSGVWYNKLIVKTGENMQSIWGKRLIHKEYSQKSFDLATNLISKNRIIAKREFLGNNCTCHIKNLHEGNRFKDDEQILWVLQSNVNEKDFVTQSDRYLQQVLLGALIADYWYKFEKEW
jgi:hypothetical protein